MAPAPEEKGKEYTLAEVAQHNKADDCWLVIGNDATGGPKVFDVTSYMDDHPGGAEVLLDVGGQDADEFFEDIGHSDDARAELKNYLVGTLVLSPEEVEERRRAAEKKGEGGGGAALVGVAVAVALAATGYHYYANHVAEA